MWVTVRGLADLAGFGDLDNEWAAILGNAVHRGQQFVHTCDHCNLRSFAGASQAPIVSVEPRIETNRDQDRHP